MPLPLPEFKPSKTIDPPLLSISRLGDKRTHDRHSVGNLATDSREAVDRESTNIQVVNCVYEQTMQIESYGRFIE